MIFLELSIFVFIQTSLKYIPGLSDNESTLKLGNDMAPNRRWVNV